MSLWLNTFCVSFVLFMLAYLVNAGAVANVPTLFVMAVISLTAIRILYRTHMVVAGPIAGAFGLVLLMTLVFTGKQIIMSGTAGGALALKILLYHLVFLAGLLVGYYDPPAPERRGWLYAALLFFVPLAFFVLFAAGNSPSQALSVFNRNSFAGFTIIGSALLLGVATGRPLVSLPFYVGIVCAALLINTTLGALLAFLLATGVYIGPQVLLNKRVMVGVILTLLVGALTSTYLVANPGALGGIEAVERIRFVYNTFLNLFTRYTGSWLELDMATAVRFAPSGELDMSAIFRLLHWLNILDTMASKGPGAIWIGGGTDWIDRNESRFTYTLAAHNEYVRLTVEQGLIHTVVIFAGLYAGNFAIRRSPLFIPIFASTLYLGTENLLNNFVATSIYFFFFGCILAVERRRLVKAAMPMSHESFLETGLHAR